jgi:hypothetical protein
MRSILFKHDFKSFIRVCAYEVVTLHLTRRSILQEGAMPITFVINGIKLAQLTYLEVITEVTFKIQISC